MARVQKIRRAFGNPFAQIHSRRRALAGTDGLKAVSPYGEPMNICPVMFRNVALANSQLRRTRGVSELRSGAASYLPHNSIRVGLRQRQRDSGRGVHPRRQETAQLFSSNEGPPQTDAFTHHIEPRLMPRRSEAKPR